VKPYRVGLAPEAFDQIERVQSWWAENRRAAPGLFMDEFRAAVDRLARAPGSGVLFPHPRLADEIRRVLMPRTRYHVYYTVDDDAALVWIVAVWHSLHGQGPPLL
jgi:plasmid stabilization system protein ParE